MKRTRRVAVRLVGLFVVAVLAVPAAAHAQSAQDIITRAMDSYEARLSGIENLTIEVEAMGMTVETYLVKEMVDGRPVLQPVSTDVEGMPSDTAALETDDMWAESWRMFDDTQDRWTLEGQGSVDGRATWRLRMTDFEGLDLSPEMPGQEGQFDADLMVMELDQERLVPLRMELEGTVRQGGEASPVAMQMQFEDYREVDGYLHPFLSIMDVDMDMAMGPEGQDAKEALEELRRQMADMPEAQRQMMEQMMGEQIRMLESMVGEEGLRMELRVVDLRVNAGPPSP